MKAPTHHPLDDRCTSNTAADNELRFGVEEALRWDPSVPWMKIGVLVADRIVTLAGTVATPAERTAVLDAARRVHGVRTLVDDIVVSSDDDSCPLEHAIARAAQRLLQSTLIVPDATVTVSGSVITLAGSVDRPAQRAAVAHALRGLEGVTWVRNDLTVRNVPRGQ